MRHFLEMSTNFLELSVKSTPSFYTSLSSSNKPIQFTYSLNTRHISVFYENNFKVLTSFTPEKFGTSWTACLNVQMSFDELVMVVFGGREIIIVLDQEGRRVAISVDCIHGFYEDEENGGVGIDIKESGVGLGANVVITKTSIQEIHELLKLI